MEINGSSIFPRKNSYSLKNFVLAATIVVLAKL